MLGRMILLILLTLAVNNHCVKSVQIRSFFVRYFPVIGLNTEIYKANLHIQFEYGKYGPENTPYWNTFHADIILILFLFYYKLF